jgi:hypothetical protein
VVARFYDLTERSGDDAPQEGVVAVAFELEGTYVENCNCDVICPCTWSSLSLDTTHDRCNVVKGVGSRISLLGIEYSGDGTAGFSAPFSWAA